MSHEISQAPATVVLCNRVIDKLNDIQANVAAIATLDLTPDMLLTLSLVTGWCRDARSIVLEIKSQL